MSLSTSASGVYFDCGYGKPVGVNITCTGSSCPALLTYPDLVCTSDSLTTNCNNQVTSCPDNLLPNFQSKFTIFQNADGSVNVDQSLSVDGNQYSGTDVDGHVSYGPLPQAVSAPVAGPPPASPPSTSTATQVMLPTSPISPVVEAPTSPAVQLPTSMVVQPPTSLVVQPPTSLVVQTLSSANRVSIKRRSSLSLFFGLIIMMNIFFAQIQAYSFGGINTGFLTGSVILYPIILSTLSIGVQGQCPVYFTYLNVKFSRCFLIKF